MIFGVLLITSTLTAVGGLIALAYSFFRLMPMSPKTLAITTLLSGAAAVAIFVSGRELITLFSVFILITALAVSLSIASSGFAVLLYYLVKPITPKLMMKRFVIAFEVFLIILALFHLIIFSNATGKFYGSRQIYGLTDFPVSGNIENRSLTINLYPPTLDSLENKNLKILAAMNLSSSRFGGVAGHWEFFFNLPAALLESCIVENFNDNYVKLKYNGQRILIHRNKSKHLKFLEEEDYFSGTRQNIDVLITHKGTFDHLTIVSYWPREKLESFDLDSDALLLEVHVHKPGLEYHWGPVLVLFLSLLGSFVLPLKNKEVKILGRQLVKLVLFFCGILIIIGIFLPWVTEYPAAIEPAPPLTGWDLIGWEDSSKCCPSTYGLQQAPATISTFWC